MNLQLDSKKIALILKGYFLFYSFEIGNCTVSDLGKKSILLLTWKIPQSTILERCFQKSIKSTLV